MMMMMMMMSSVISRICIDFWMSLASQRLEQACGELLAQPLFDGFLVPNDCAECAITLLGDIANSSEHRGNAEGALHLLCAAVTHSPSVREDPSLYGETGCFTPWL